MGHPLRRSLKRGDGFHEETAGGNAASPFSGSVGTMKIPRLLVSGLLLAAVCLAQDPVPTRQIPVNPKAGTFPLTLETDFLGTAGKKTVTRIRLTAPELTREAVNRGVKGFSGRLKGGFRQPDETEVDSFDYSVTSEVSTANPFSFSFLRAVPPGNYRLRLLLTDPDGREMGEGSVEVLVPGLGTVFRPEMAPGEAGTLPSAEAIVIAGEAEEPAGTPAEPKL